MLLCTPCKSFQAAATQNTANARPWDIKWNYISLTLSYMDTRSKFSSLPRSCLKVSWLGGLIDLCWIPFTNMVTQTFVVLNLV